MEDNKNTNTEVIETGAGTATETPAVDNNKTDEELFAKFDEILAKRSQGIIKSVLKDNGTEDAEIGEILSRYKASKQTAKTKEAEALSTLKTQNEELTKKLFDIELNGAAAKVAAEIGMDADKLPYAMKLADITKAISDGNVNSEALKSALEDVLKNIPEFKSKTTQEDKNTVRKVGVENTEPETIDTMNKMRKVFGLPENK